MPFRRTAAGVGALTAIPLALALATAGPAAAHGSMEDPVSRVLACFQEGPESPVSDACKALVAAGGTQPLYDWNEVNIAQAAGNHRSLIPDGELCSAGREKYRGLDLARTDWPATPMTGGPHTFRYAATAPHRGAFELYITTEGYDPSQPVTWSGLEKFAEVTDPALENGAYVIDAEVPGRTGRHLIYSVWQRSDSPEAFYTCSDVVFDGSAATARSTDTGQDGPADSAAAEHSGQAEPGHSGHGTHGDTEAPEPADAAETPGEEVPGENGQAEESGENGAAGGPVPQGGTAQEARLAATGSDSGLAPAALAGAGALAAGAAVLFAARRRAAGRHRA